MLPKSIFIIAFFIFFTSYQNQIYSQAVQNDVIINEFVVNPTTGKEWVELLVTKPGGISLMNWVLTDVGSRTSGTTSTEGHLYLPQSGYLSLLPKETRIVLVLHTPVANTVQFTQDLDPTDSVLILFSKGISGGVLDTGRTMDISTNENLVLLNDTSFATATVIDYVATGNNTSISGWSGAIWTNNLPASTGNTVQYFTNSPGNGFINDDGSSGWMANKPISDATPGQANNSQIVSVREILELPIQFSLYQNYPNPFNPATKIEYHLPVVSNVILKVYDILGQEVITLVKGTHTTGRYECDFDASKLCSGVYIYKLVAYDNTSKQIFVDVKKMIHSK